MVQFSLQTELPLTPEQFWAGMSMQAINAELGPWVRITAPASWRDCPLEQWQTGTVLFRSVLLLFGLLPVDLHALRLEQIDVHSGFLERSHSLMNRRWEHERRTVATAAGCVVTDRLHIESRIPGLDRLLLPVYRAIFRHRHRQLRKRYAPAN